MRYLLAARLCSVFFMHVADCDETYNYWEPVSATHFVPFHAGLDVCFSPLQFHYILYGKGYQTWEYSPAYALRSYGYILLHTLPMQLTYKAHKNNKVRYLLCVCVHLCVIVHVVHRVLEAEMLLTVGWAENCA